MLFSLYPRLRYTLAVGYKKNNAGVENNLRANWHNALDDYFLALVLFLFIAHSKRSAAMGKN